MKKRKYTRNIDRLRFTQGCLTDCVAYVLNLHPWKVPFFVYPRMGWNERLKKYLRKQGYAAHWTTCDTPPKRGTHILCGDSLIWKTAAHVVVYRNGKLAYDPQYPSLWRDDRVTHRLVLAKL